MRKLSLMLSVIIACGCDRVDSESVVPTDTVRIADWASRIDTLAGEYTRVVRPAEFWDSVLIVPDLAERQLWKVNIATGERELFGSRGGGPGEYERPSWAFKVHTDSVAIVGAVAGASFPVISVATGIGRTTRVSLSSDSAFQTVRITERPIIRSADTLGYLYANSKSYSTGEGKRQWPDGFANDAVPTSARLRLSVRTGVMDTAGYVPVNLKARRRSQLGRSGSVTRTSAGPYSPHNGWTTLPDGRTVMAAGGAYLLEVMGESGALQGAWTLDYPPVAASQMGYDTWVDSMRKQSSALMATTLTRVGATQMPPQREIIFPPKPAQLPPLNFGGNSMIFGAGDVVWLPVHVEDPPGREIWDLVHIVERRRLCRVALEDRQRLLLVTQNGAYVAALDELDLEHLVRFQPPVRGCQ